MEVPGSTSALHGRVGGMPNTNNIKSSVNEYKTRRTSDIGLLKSTLLPSLGLNTSLSALSYLLSLSTNRVEIKDCFWGGNQVVNVWWTALGKPICQSNLTVAKAWNNLSWTEKLLLFSVSLWGTRLLYRVASRGIRRTRSGKGNDDPRYTKVKKQYGFWKTAFWKLYLPEAVFQSVIALPFTIPFRGGGTVPPTGNGRFQDIARAVGVGFFGVGFALEVLADVQLSCYRGSGLQRGGVWSIVRHPNYLGDIIIHSSFAILSLAESFHPVVLLGPLANYVFLRCVGGDKENEAYQEDRYKHHNEEKYRDLQESKRQKNSVWPHLRELANPWTWAVVGCGAAVAFLEEVAKGWYEGLS
ncbi:hypothetical protein MPDQ_001658 [Monascus purpureus]|uniref:Uncharacterized protein n=1 Tax=Monascus purpureus TaxID=5098 RepID=A0A507QRG3_MONPU|nr:hypothetical protein MPDQ_001658 [Monascus purpureus]BDD64391.1 hypothetical protein MAP00_009216 [Monascus purpureus]